MIYTHIFLLLCWVGYCLLHTLLAASSWKDWVYQHTIFNRRTYRLFYNLLAVILLVWMASLQVHVISEYIFQPGSLGRISGLILAIAGLSIMGISIKKYFREMSGLYKNTPDVLQVDGLHQFVRHPLYLGTFCFIAGIFLYWPYYKNALMLLVIIIYTLVAIRYEERKLLSRFGEVYNRYCKKVPMILPSLYKKSNFTVE